MSMPPMLTEAASTPSSGRVSASKKTKAGPKSPVLEQIAEHVLLDGFRIVIDLEKSKGSYLYDCGARSAPDRSLRILWLQPDRV